MEKKYELLEVRPNVDALRAFREEYIKTFEGSPICKIISRTDKWYKNINGNKVYSSSKLGIGVIPILKNSKDFQNHFLDMDKFIKYGPCNVLQARAIKMDAQDTESVINYFYLFEGPCSTSSKLSGYKTPALKIDEDIYNMIMIQFRKFNLTTTPQDLSRYSDFFTVGDAYAKLEFSASMIEDLYRCSVMSYDQINEMLEDLELQEIAINSLRKK